MPNDETLTLRVTFIVTGDDPDGWREQVGDGTADIYDSNVESDTRRPDGTTIAGGV